MATIFRLIGVSGSLRAGSFSTAILKTLAEEIASRATMELADIAALPHYNQDLEDDPPASVVTFKTQVARADGIVIVTSEFNHGVPGVLKNAIDWGSRPAFDSPFKAKPVLIITSSPAFTGGVRAQYQLREALASMLARPVLTPEIVIGGVHAKVAGGRLIDRIALDYSLSAFETLYREIRMVQSAAASVAPAE